MRTAVLLVVLSTACTTAAMPDSAAGPAYTALALADATVTIDNQGAYVFDGRILVDDEDEVRLVAVDLVDGGEVRLGLEPTGETTDWIVTLRDADGVWVTTRLPGTLDQVVIDGCVEMTAAGSGSHDLRAVLLFC